MKAYTLATLAVIAVQQVELAGAGATAKENNLGDLSLEELLQLRESILEAKQNLTYYIEESDDDEDDDDDDNQATAVDDENGEAAGLIKAAEGEDDNDGGAIDDDSSDRRKVHHHQLLPQKVDELLDEPKNPPTPALAPPASVKKD